MRGMLALGLVWPSKWVGRVVRDNRMCWQCLDGRPQKNLAFLMLKWGVCSLRGSLDLQNGLDGPWGPTRCLDKVLKDVHKKFGIFDLWIRFTQKMVCYSTRKMSKWGVCSLRGSFSNWFWQAVRANRMHRQGLDARPQKNFAFLTSKSGSPKKWFAIAHENRRNEGYARIGAR